MPTLLPVLEACTPRPAEQASRNYAADLHRALHREIGSAAAAADFFASTYATDAMRRVAAGIFGRLRHGDAGNADAVIRFHSVFGGGKTHTLIALAAAARHPQLVGAGAAGGLLPDELAVNDVRLICFTGENADVIQGMAMDGTDRRAQSLTGYLAYHLGGAAAYDAHREYDASFSDPGADGFQRLIGDRPTLILLDELVRWVAAAKQRDGSLSRAGDGLRNALTAIAKAVSNCPRAVLVITTPEPGHDAYQDETQQVHEVMQAVDSVLSRTARDYTPTETADFPAILRRRLFVNAEAGEQRDAAAAAYAAVWHRYNPSDTDARRRFYDCYPFHPETLRVITERLASNNDFQRVRGTLRAAAAVIHSDNARSELAAPLIHPYHLDVAVPGVREELVNRTGHQALDAAIQADVVGPHATARRFGSATRRAANIILLGSLAPTANNGLADTEIVNGLISPAEPDAAVAMQAVRNMKDYGLFIDDNPDAGTTRFNRLANVRREVEQRANAVSENDREDGLKQAIHDAFADRNGLGITVFPSRANNVPDDPNLAHIGIINPSHITTQSVDRNEQLAALYHHNDGNGGQALREYRNNALFLVPDNDDLTEIKRQIARHKVAAEMLQNDSQEPRLMEYQRNTLETIRQASHKAVYQGIQRNWVNLYYPEPNVRPHGLADIRLQFPDREGRGQDTVIEFLTGNAVGKMAHPRQPALGGNVWAAAGLARAGADGITVGELHGRFTRTPGRIMFLKRADFDRALDAANQVSANQDDDAQIVVIRTPQGLEIQAGSGVAYRDDMRVWLKRDAPNLAPPEPEPPPPPAPYPAPGPAAQRIPRFASPTNTGQVAVSNLAAHMQTYAVDWKDIADATLMGTDAAMLNDLASKAQSNGAAVSITYEFDANGFALLAQDKTAEEWQRCRRACEQMQRAAGADTVDASIAIPNDDANADAVRTMLHDLDNTHQVTLEVRFRQPDA